ncbi:MAG TPA: hypothetical protein VL371_21030, partial [Gemmataceae bacterium]|nr:hypothetical protein [Gemmataceae bacterium]
MSRYQFDVATEADDADLRRVLAETPMPGRIAVSFRREPSYFAAAEIDGRFRQVVAARELNSGRIIGFGSRSVCQRYVNGLPTPIGYLSSLRLLAEHRNRGLVARGYAYFRRLHADRRAPLYLTTIAEGNALALRLLTSGRAGLPRYHPAGQFLTAAIPWRQTSAKAPPAESASLDVRIRPATLDDVPAALDFLHAVGPRRQFFPCYDAEDLFTPCGPLRGLGPDDVLLAIRGGAIVGTLGAWDQSDFRQTVVHGYGPPLSWVRPIYNAWARRSGRPRLPGAGDRFRCRFVALPLVADDDPVVFAALLDAVLTRVCDADYIIVGLHEADPLLPVLRRHRATWYRTHLFHVCWDDGEPVRQSLDGRPPYLE